jgi:hypothetical protein
MILQFDEHDYCDVEKIVALRWLPRKGAGVIIFEGDRIIVGRTEYTKIEDAYRWAHSSHMYGPDKRVIKLVEKKGENDGRRSKTLADTTN